MDWNPLYQIIGATLAFLIMQVVRYVGRTRFWRKVAARAERFIDDPTVPIVDPREAAERALVEAQRAQLDEVERSIHRGGNGMKLGDDDITPRHLPPRKPERQ
jgi:hypothetical protein